MPRRPRVVLQGIPVHYIQRGNNRGPVFGDHHDRRRYRALLLEGCDRFECAVHAYVFMTNHVHLLLTPGHDDALARLTQWMGRHYVTAYNRRHHRTGTLWEGRFRSSLIDSARYLLTCSRYIDQNPVRAGAAPTPAAYRWSSYGRLGLGRHDDLITEHEAYRALGATPQARQAAYRALCAPSIEPQELCGIRVAAHRSTPLGSASFIDGLTRRVGWPVDRLRHGGDRRSAEFSRGMFGNPGTLRAPQAVLSAT